MCKFSKTYGTSLRPLFFLAILFFCNHLYSQTQFPDSARQKTSRKTLTRKLYDLVVISPQLVENKKFTGSSDASYISYSGKKIRNIEIIRMDVFGTNINNPASVNQKKINYILNKTHANSGERIIRKNILFSEGDTLSPLMI